MQHIIIHHLFVIHQHVCNGMDKAVHSINVTVFLINTYIMPVFLQINLIAYLDFHNPISVHRLIIFRPITFRALRDTFGRSVEYHIISSHLAVQ